MSAVIIDAYAHVGLPRFQSVDDYQGVMDAAGIERAVLCAFGSCPDIAGVHAALRRWPGRFRELGVPIGHGRDEIEAAARAQLAAGFSGLRLSDADVVERPWLLDILAAARGIAVVCVQVAAPACARVLVEHLDRHDAAVVVGGHFAGVDRPAALDDRAVAALFAHPQFFIVFSRQGASPAPAVRTWAEEVLGLTDWERVMWGSEAPVLFWRNETMGDALAWAEQLRPTEAQRAGFFGETARRLCFDAAVTPAPLRLPFDPWDRARGLPVEQAVAGRLVAAWFASGGQGTLGEYAEKLLDGVLAPLPDGQ